MRNHPGSHIKKLCLEPNGLSVTDAANLLGISRKNFSLLINGHAGISAEMAIRLEKVFGVPSQEWLKIQMDYELKIAKKRNLKLKKFKK
jgi:addiction module HigA family antidote